MGTTVTLKAADGFSLAAYTAGSADAKAGLVVVQIEHGPGAVVDLLEG